MRRLNDTDINTPPTVALPTVSEENEPQDDLAVELPIFNLGRITPLKNVTQKDLDQILTSSTPIPKAQKRKFVPDSAISLSSGWLNNLFENMNATEIPKLQLLNWKYRQMNGNQHLCVTLSDGTYATKQAIVTENLVEAVKEAPLYSVLEIKSGTIMDGCMFLIQEIDALNTEVLS